MDSALYKWFLLLLLPTVLPNLWFFATNFQSKESASFFFLVRAGGSWSAGHSAWLMQRNNRDSDLRSSLCETMSSNLTQTFFGHKIKTDVLKNCCLFIFPASSVFRFWMTGATPPTWCSRSALRPSSWSRASSRSRWPVSTVSTNCPSPTSWPCRPWTSTTL